ncbi:hypothetical protein PHMEG_00014175 [Phytophthora megakarya]|uniref:Uncharacterized protein n=1 Tax=Phytophthora megakarya TaxID=4795 RepID=A0A225W4Z7_9STRA|nr:hypothetical protein PHMEG_00014175 [Phytophthora megakarya]
MADLQQAHDQLGELRDLAEGDLAEDDLLLTHLASRIRESQAARMPKRDRNNPEIEGPKGEELEDKREIPGGGGGDPDDDNPPSSEDGSSTPPPSPHRSPGGSPGGGSSPQLNPPLFPAEANVPLHSTTRIFTAAEITPWDPAIVVSIPIIAMIQSTLAKWLPIPPGFLFPARSPFVRAPIPRSGYRSELITGANLVLRRNRPTRLTFDHNLHWRANNLLWQIAVSYAGLEEDHLIAYWESTHYLEVTKAMLASDPDLFIYHQDQRQRRICVGDRWRKLFGACLPMMRSQWVDIDLLLDPYFLHLPMPQHRVRWYPGSVSRAVNLAQPTANLPEPTDLITALFECGQADPWWNHYRDSGTAHPSLQIPRLANKFNPPAAP